MSERADITKLPGNHVHSVVVPSVAKGAEGSQIPFVNKTGATIQITGVSLTVDTATTADGTDKFLLSLINRGAAGAGTTSVAALQFNASVNAAAYTEKAITLSATAANLLVADGNVLELVKAEAGAGALLPEGNLTITYKFV